MNLMPVISVVVFLILLGASIAVYRHLRREVNEADGVHGINEQGKPGFSDEKNIIGKI